MTNVFINTCPQWGIQRGGVEGGGDNFLRIKNQV